jgi:hypothetical protein
MGDRLTELRIREEEAAREWQWLQDTLNKVARGRTEAPFGCCNTKR